MVKLYVRTATGKIQMSEGSPVTRDYVCSRCLKEGEQVTMRKTSADPDVGEKMICPKCGWTSLRPKDVYDPDEVVE